MDVDDDSYKVEKRSRDYYYMDMDNFNYKRRGTDESIRKSLTLSVCSM